MVHPIQTEQSFRLTDAPQGVRAMCAPEAVSRTEAELAALAWDNEYNIGLLERQIEKAEADAHFDRARAAQLIAQYRSGIQALKRGLNRNQPSVDRAVRNHAAWLETNGAIPVLQPITTAVRMPDLQLWAAE